MDMQDYRKQIDSIDEKLVKLFEDRMEIAKAIAEYKKANDLPVFDQKREREKLNEIVRLAGKEEGAYAPMLYSLIFELSRSYQNKLNGGGSDLTSNIKKAIEETPQLFPENASVACQGVEGSNSQYACDKLFKNPELTYCATFDGVFKAIENGECKYGVIPVENSNAGSVNSVYDLMMNHNFKIVRSIRTKIKHNLLAKKGAKLEDIKEIYSHGQAISQCSKYLETLDGVRVIPVENTAIGAKMVAESERKDVAALASLQSMRYYGLESLKNSVQNTDNNYTRFIVISKELEIYPGANRTSLMLTLYDETGALYKFLAKLYSLEINLNKLESRPIPEREFEFMFYFDLDTPVYSPRLMQLIDELPYSCESFHYLGSYSEIF